MHQCVSRFDGCKGGAIYFRWSQVVLSSGSQPEGLDPSKGSPDKSEGVVQYTMLQESEMSLSAGINIPVWCKPLLCHCTTLQTSCCRLWRSRWSPQRSSEQRQSGRDTVRCSKTGSSEIMASLKKWTQPRTTWELRVTWVRVSPRAKIFCWPPVKYTLSILLSWSFHNKVWCQRGPTSTVMIPPFPHTGCVSLHLW